MTILAFPRTTAPQSPRPRPGLTMTPLHDDLLRVTRSGGEVLGYVERFGDGGGIRYRAKRMIPLQRRFIALGEFWTVDEAIDCFG